MQSKDFFFQKEGFDRKKGFDSYSKDVNDIVNFYYIKHPEISAKYKNDFFFIEEDFDHIELIPPSKLQKPFEQYIIAFIYAMKEDYENAQKTFTICISILDDSFEAKINKVFIRLQLAQIQERIGNYRLSLSTLLSVYKEFYKNRKLLNSVSNFYASCCLSIGLVLFRHMKQTNMARVLFEKSIDLRLRFKETYPEKICENYLSIAYRYKAIVCAGKRINKYLTFKQSYKIRIFLLENTNDEFTKLEFFYLSSDLAKFLIIESFSIKYINKITRRLYCVISNFASESKRNIFKDIIDISFILAKYYYLKENYALFFKWYALLKYFKKNNKYSFNEKFLDSEEVFCIINS